MSSQFVEEIMEQVKMLSWSELGELEKRLAELIQEIREEKVEERYQKYGNY